MSSLPPPPDGMEWVWVGEGEPDAISARSGVDQMGPAAIDGVVPPSLVGDYNGSSPPTRPPTVVPPVTPSDERAIEAAPSDTTGPAGRRRRSRWMVNGLTLVIDLAIILLLLELAHFL